MELRGEKISPLFITVALMLITTFSICAFALSSGGGSLDLTVSYYFVCCYIKDNALSASTLSVTVSNYGGAGYVLEYDGSYYVTVACYYTERDADTVCESLKRRELDCTVLEAERDGFSLLTRTAKGRESLYAGNLNTLNSLSRLAYDCANEMDKGNYNQSAAKSVISDIESGLKGLKSANTGNCFSGEIERLLAECGQASNGYVYSKNLRRLQIAVIDCILNVELY